MQWSAYVVIVLFAGIVLVGLAAHVWQYRDRPGAPFFLLALIGGASYAFGYAGQLVATTLTGKLAWYFVQMVPFLVLAPAMVLFAMEFTGVSRWQGRTLATVLAVEPVLVFATAISHPFHDLYFRETSTEIVGGLVWLDVDPGPVLLLDTVYQYALFFAVVGFFVYLLIESSPLYRDQAATLILAVLLPLFGSSIHRLVLDSNVDPVPLSFAVTGLIVTLGVFRVRLMDVVPVDWSPILDEVRAGVFAVDRQGRVVEANDGARALFDGGGTPIGRNATNLLDGSLDVDLGALEDGSTIESADSEDGPYYEVRRSRITDAKGVPRGELVVLYDVTDRTLLEHELRRQNEQLTVLNRMLRHDVRNDVTVALGRAEVLREHVDEAVADEHLDPIVSANRHISELTEISRDLAEAVGGESSLDSEPVSVSTSLNRTIDRVKARYPEATFDEPATDPAVNVEANDLLDSVFSNLLNNAIQHNDRQTPRVDVGLEVLEEDDEIRIRIADDGPGIPDQRKDVIFGRGERGIGSGGMGLGLYLVDRIVDEYGGRVWIEDNEPRGTVFVVAFPLA